MAACFVKTLQTLKSHPPVDYSRSIFFADFYAYGAYDISQLTGLACVSMEYIDWKLSLLIYSRVSGALSRLSRSPRT